jgi:hypothetical protein
MLFNLLYFKQFLMCIVNFNEIIIIFQMKSGYLENDKI